MKDSHSIDERLREVIEAAYAHAPAIRDHFNAAGLKPEAVQTVADLEQVPVLPKDRVIALQHENPPFGGFLAAPLSEVRHIFFSPGPLFEPDVGDDVTSLTMAQRCLEMASFNAGDVVLNTLSYHLVPAGLLFDWTLGAMKCTVVPGGVGNSDLQIKMMRDLDVTAYTGTPSFLMSLIHRIEEMGLDFRRDFKLRKAAVTAEPLPPSLRQTLTDQYGLSVANIYATAELGLLAINTGGGMAMQLMPEPIIQVVDPDTGRVVGAGEAGEVVVTTFNRAYPLIRLGTGDLAVNVDPTPGQSRQEDRAIILVGRSGEAVKVRGMFVHPNQLRFALSQVPGVAAFQAVVSRPDDNDRVTLRVRLAEGADGEALSGPMQEAVRAVCRVRINEVVFVPAAELSSEAPAIVDERQWN
jgi:phenylacetate-CoA ligase